MVIRAKVLSVAGLTFNGTFYAQNSIVTFCSNEEKDAVIAAGTNLVLVSVDPELPGFVVE